ncbi:DNA glycosylase AlkZ-like family protein [Geodermatophilus chilensis]|uniref:DNA glycosylase AlkZ-like family protein n=1 Tax=Geodermatophilus chilensis TaxID=2035835 RepID=UPI000C266F54|nr:crosslink repair DNA glycosylase YcaQ family protein [Geodermatophilus chilensis]
MTVHRLSPTDARRIAVRAQLLDAERSSDLLAVVQHLTLLQIDPTAAVAPSADLVAWSRLGRAHRPADLRRALEQDRTLWEFNALVRPMADLRLYRAGMARWPGREQPRQWLAVNEPFRRDVLARLADAGPLTSRDIPDTSVVPWASTGWTNARNVTQMLELLALRGEVAVAGRRGQQRLWDLADRVYPPDTPVVPLEEARRIRQGRRLRALGIARAGHPGPPNEMEPVSEAGEEAVVEGVPGTWRVDPALLGQPFAGRTALLSPFDRLVHDRTRLAELFGFEYVLETYRPRAARRWGYFALPVLSGDRLVGKVDATADRRGGVLRVDAVHEDVPLDAAERRGVRDELADLAAWLGLDLGGAAVPR